jgi:hypothetical protein
MSCDIRLLTLSYTALTEAVRRRPYQVILLDEFEKAHKEVSCSVIHYVIW